MRFFSSASVPRSTPGRAAILPFFSALRSFSSIGSQATVARNAASRIPVASVSPFGTYMPAVRRSRAAPGASTICAESRLRASSGGRNDMPSGKIVQRSMVAIHLIGKFDSTWSMACCAW